ncbi:MAG: PaaX family transcriptional regulator C-terminal domain-containing protein, partial [Beijerinckiaceae bacterium]
MIELATLDSGHAPSLTALHAEKPLRVWSLIVTIFGDVVMERGTKAHPPAIWTAPLLELLELLGIDAALARTNLSRLVANGTLERSKSGRNTFYKLSAMSRAEFTKAAPLIYGAPPQASGLHVALLDRCPQRSKARESLVRQGFVMAGPALAFAPGRGAPPVIPTGVLLAQPYTLTEEWCAAIAELWKLPALDAAAKRFVKDFQTLQAGAALSPAQAITARIALVHQFRRLALRDPGLPVAALPDPWTMTAARLLFTA